MLVSLVIPTYNEAATLPCLRTEVGQLAAELADRGVKLEVVLVDNLSSDGTWECIRTWVDDSHKLSVVGIRHPHNLGMQQSLLTGVRATSGQAIAVLQADLQDPPLMVLKMIDAWMQGSLVVVTQMEARNESPLQRLASWFFYWLLRVVAGSHVRRNSTDFYLFDRTLLSELTFRTGSTPFLRSTLASLSESQTTLVYTRSRRVHGTAMNFRGKMKFAIDALLTNLSGIVAKMALASVIIGCLAALALFALIVAFVSGYRSPVGGWITSTVLFMLIICLGLFLAATQLEYLNRIYRDLPRPDWLSRSELYRRPH